MEKEILQVQMLGGFSLVYQGKTLVFDRNYTSKSTQLLQILFLHLENGIPKEQLLDELYSRDDVENRNGSLNNTISVSYTHLDVYKRQDTFSFKADEKLAELAEKVCHEVNPEIQVFRGRIVSGDQFIAEKAVKERIAENFQGYCTEMEGAAIAQAAYLNEVPFVVLRAISDKADDSATMDYPTFEAKAAEHCVKLVEHFLELL